MQITYDCFTALKHNITDIKLTAVLFHRICGNYDEERKAMFTDMFKQLKQWLFGTYRTAAIPQNTYITVWKAWKMFQSAKETKIVSYERFYKKPLSELYPNEEYMYVSSTPITEPVYYLYKPEKKSILETKNDDEMVIEKDDDQIPSPSTMETAVLPVQNFFDYMFRNFNCDIKFGCEWCRTELTPCSVDVTLKCTHFVHRNCLEDNFICPVCKYC